MRFGGPLYGKTATPEDWVRTAKAHGYRAAYCPVDAETSDDVLRAYVKAAQDADLVIAEVGAWSNPISPDEAIRRAAIEKCIRQLALADRIGARCCVNIAGARGEKWDGPHPENLTEATFEMIVETVRHIIDAVRPTRTFYALETMPWVFPDSPESYERIIHAIARPAFAVHLDPVNLVNSPARFFRTDELIRECFARLGPYIKSCHAKDIALGETLTVHLDEVRPGLGGLDYRVFLTELNRLDADIPLMLEHLHTESEYTLAAEYIRGVAAELSVAL
jgi:sugar phosphate isomerase/epimerase